MSAKSSRTKCVILDAAFFSFSIGLSIYCVLFVAQAMGIPGEFATQDYAVANMSMISLVTAVILLGSALISALLYKTGTATLGTVLFATPSEKNQIAPAPFFKSFWGIHFSLTFLLSVIIGLRVSDFSLVELTDPEGFAGALRLYNGLIHANLGILPTAIVQIVETFFTAFLATLISLPIAFVLSVFSAKNIMTGPVAFSVYAALRTLLNIVRSVEPLIWALIFTVWVGIGPFAGMLALMIHSVAALAKQFSETLEDVSELPIEGIRSTGANTLQTLWYAVVPQVTLQFVAFSIYRWDTNVRMATIIGLVGGGGIGTLLIKYQGQAMWPEVGCIILVITALVWLMDVASAYIREALK